MANPKIINAEVVSAALNTVRVDFDQAMRQDAIFYDVSNWSVSDHTITSVTTELGTASGVLHLGEEMTNAVVLSVEVSSVTNEIAEPIDGAFSSIGFVGVGVRPQVQSVTATGPLSVTVTFNESMQSAGRDSAANYTISSPIGASQVTVSSIEIVDSVSSIVHLNREMTNGAAYSITLTAPPFIDNAGNSLAVFSEDVVNVAFTGLGTAPQMSSAVLEDDGTLTITFDEDMCDEGALVSRYNYLIEPVNPGSAAVFVKSVTRKSTRVVSLEISETTSGASYEVASDGVRDVAKNAIDPLFASANFIGAGSSPRVVMIRAIGPNRVDVIFSEEMLDNDDIRDPTHYSFTGDLQVLSATPDVGDARIVQLVTSAWIANTEYTLTITP